MKNKYKIKDYTLFSKVETRWRDLDAFQHVNNAVYATYIETARVDLFKRWGIPGSNTGRSIIMASLKIDYFSQLKHPNTILIGQKVVSIRNTSFEIESILFNENDTAICRSLVVAVCFDFDTQRPVKVYDTIKNDFKK